MSNENHQETQPQQSANTAGDLAAEVALQPGEKLIDFGPLVVPVAVGTQVRPVITGDLCESITVLIDNWQVNLAVIAAPRSGKYWERHVQKMIEANPDAYTVITTNSGPELLVKESTDNVPMRIAGIDGPGWVLRVVYIGKIAHDMALREEAKKWLDRIHVTRAAGVFLPGEIMSLNLRPLLEHLYATGQAPEGATLD